MKPIDIFLEIGSKRVYAGAVDWPGWYGGGRDEKSALQALLAYGPRYADAIQGAQLGFHAPTDEQLFNVIERLPGNSTTDFGAPDMPPTVDAAALDAALLRQSQALLGASWDALLAAYHAALGKELRKGPRGGGRELDGIIDHVVNAHASYLRRINWKPPGKDNDGVENTLDNLKQATDAALSAAVTNGLPEKSSRGGKIWPPRTFVRRATWHILDHVWEIEDRVLKF